MNRGLTFQTMAKIVTVNLISVDLFPMRSLSLSFFLTAVAVVARLSFERTYERLFVPRLLFLIVR